MESLLTYLRESLEVFEKFDKTTNNIDDLFKMIKKSRVIVNGRDTIQNFLTQVLSVYGDLSYVGDPFIYDSNASYFKIKYDFGDAIRSVVNSGEFPSITFKMNGVSKMNIFYNGSKFAETGSGSIGRVNTESQETATCVVFNAVVEELKKDPEYKFNYDFISDLIKDISADFDKEWVASFYQQITGVLGYIRKCGEDPTAYRMERYGGSKKFSDWKVSKAYEKFVSTYTRVFVGSKKDNWDPSDVILFRIDAESDLISTFNGYASQITDEQSANSVKARFIEKYYTDNNIIFKGISLKKISAKKNPQIDVYNVGESSKVSSVHVDHDSLKESKSTIYVIVDGKFKFDNTTDEMGDEIRNEDRIKLTLRSFGGSQVGVDVQLIKNGHTDPSLGKCPVAVWTSLLKTSAKDLSRSIEKFKDFVLDDSNADGVRDIILSAIKNGPNCLPYIILH